MESELNGRRSQMARVTKLVTLYKRGANAMEYPKPTSTYQGVSGYERRKQLRDKVQLAVCFLVTGRIQIAGTRRI